MSAHFTDFEKSIRVCSEKTSAIDLGYSRMRNKKAFNYPCLANTITLN